MVVFDRQRRTGERRTHKPIWPVSQRGTCYINVYSKGRRSHDLISAEYENVEAARIEALASGREMIASQFAKGKAAPRDFSVDITDECGAIADYLSLLTIVFGAPISP